MCLTCFINGVLAIVAEFHIALKPVTRHGKGPKLLQEQARSDGLEGAELVNDSVCIQAQLGGGFRLARVLSSSHGPDQRVSQVACELPLTWS